MSANPRLAAALQAATAPPLAEGRRFAVRAYADGTALLVLDQAGRRSVALVGDEALRFRAELEARLADTGHADEVLGALWFGGLSARAQACDTAADDPSKQETSHG